MLKSLLKPLTIAEIKQGGEKITSMGDARRKEVMLTISNNRGSAKNTAARLKAKYGGKRNWNRVATTEMTDAKAKASLGLIEALFGVGAKVYRKPNPKCCSDCKTALGHPVAKIFTISEIPLDIRGAIHPNCVCGEWRPLEKPHLVKSMGKTSELIGTVMISEGVAIVSTGSYWALLDSTIGRTVIQCIANALPLVKIGSVDGFTVYRHGYFFKDDFKKRPGRVLMCDIRNISGLRFYDQKDPKIVEMKTFDDYITFLKRTIPHVATMPEYWQNGESSRYLSDFFGFRTITDWVIAAPGEPSKQGRLGWANLGLIGVRAATRRMLYKLLQKSGRA